MKALFPAQFTFDLHWDCLVITHLDKVVLTYEGSRIDSRPPLEECEVSKFASFASSSGNASNKACSFIFVVRLPRRIDHALRSHIENVENHSAQHRLIFGKSSAEWIIAAIYVDSFHFRSSIIS